MKSATKSSIVLTGSVWCGAFACAAMAMGAGMSHTSLYGGIVTIWGGAALLMTSFLLAEKSYKLLTR